MKMLLRGEGVKATLLVSRVALTPSPLAAFEAVASSFLWLGRRLVVSQCSIPEDGQGCIDLLAQQ